MHTHSQCTIAYALKLFSRLLVPLIWLHYSHFFLFHSRSNHKWFIEMKLMTDEHTDTLDRLIYNADTRLSFSFRAFYGSPSSIIISCIYLLQDTPSLLSPLNVVVAVTISTTIVCSNVMQLKIPIDKNLIWQMFCGVQLEHYFRKSLEWIKKIQWK